MKPKYFECDCESAEHSIRVVFDEEHGECYIETQLIKQPFLLRLVAGIKYIFGHQSNYGSWECTILGKEQIEQLVMDLSGFYRKHFKYDTGGKKKITRALKDIAQGKPNSAYVNKKKTKKKTA